MILGSGVAGLSVLAHMHTPPLLTSRWQQKCSRTLQFATSQFCCSPPQSVRSSRCSSTCRDFTLHDCAEGSHTSNSRPSFCCASMDKNGAVLPHAGPPLSVHSSRGLIVPLTHRNFWVFPRRSFPCEIVDVVAIESWYFSLPLCGLYVFSQWLCCPGRAVFPTFAVSCAH